MCGLVVEVSSCRLDKESERRRLRNSLETLLHRGPDDFGELLIEDTNASIYLGHRRLKILDLSQHGAQPMSRGDLSLVFNGEIYNYLELKKELEVDFGHTFQGKSDTEVLLVAWLQWGEQAIQRLEGMFAFCMFDQRQNTMHLVRDLFGVKPLYFLQDGRGLKVASEPRAIISLDRGLAKPNDLACLEFLSAAWSDRSSQTFFLDIEQLLPGHLAKYSLASAHLEVRRWGRIELADISEGKHAKHIRDALHGSVEKQLRSDVSVGFALSGGLDSSLICAVANNFGPSSIPIRSHGYSSRGSDVSEHEWQALVSNFLSSQHFEHSAREEQTTLLERCLSALGEPFAGTSILAQHSLIEGVKREGTKVLLEGQGADELFAGYDSFLPAKFVQAISIGEYGEARKIFRSLRGDLGGSLRAMLLIVAEYLHFGEPSNRFMRAVRLNFGAIKFGGVLKMSSVIWLSIRDNGKHLNPASFLSRRASHMQLRLASQLWVSSLPSLLKNSDRNSMWHSVESRVPYLTKDLAGYALSYAGTAGALTVQSKSILRTIGSDLLPEPVIGRSDKNGFANSLFDFAALDEETISRAYAGLRRLSWIRTDESAGESLFFPNLDYNSRFRLLALGLWLYQFSH